MAILFLAFPVPASVKDSATLSVKFRVPANAKAPVMVPVNTLRQMDSAPVPAKANVKWRWQREQHVITASLQAVKVPVRVPVQVPVKEM
jgi:hypothetical protein